MAFSRLDSLHECLLKMLIAKYRALDARENSCFQDELNELLGRLQVEGPERERIQKQAQGPGMDDFQISMLANELELCICNDNCQRQARALLQELESKQDRLSNLELLLAQLLRQSLLILKARKTFMTRAVLSMENRRSVES